MNNLKDKQNISFDEAVYALVQHIPKGRVCTYGLIAKALGVGKSSRLVGMILSNSHKRIIPIPAHRVVNRNGMITGKHHFETPSKMEELLKEEGVFVIDDHIQNFHDLVWNPLEELDFQDA